MDEHPLTHNLPGLPKVSLHIHMPVALEDHTFLFQQSSLPTPPWSRTPLLVHHPMARQLSGSRCIPQSPPHHPRMARPPRQRCDIPIRRHLATRNLAHDVQHVLTKPPRLLHRHLINLQNLSEKPVFLHSACRSSPLGSGPKTKRWGQAPRLSFQKILYLGA